MRNEFDMEERVCPLSAIPLSWNEIEKLAGNPDSRSKAAYTGAMAAAVACTDVAGCPGGIPGRILDTLAFLVTCANMGSCCGMPITRFFANKDDIVGFLASPFTSALTILTGFAFGLVCAPVGACIGVACFNCWIPPHSSSNINEPYRTRDLVSSRYGITQMNNPQFNEYRTFAQPQMSPAFTR